MLTTFSYSVSLCMCHEWNLITKLPEGAKEDGTKFQAVYWFVISKPILYPCQSNITVSLLYVEDPPDDKNDYCQVRSDEDYNILACRRRRKLLHSKSWVPKTLLDFLWRYVPSLGEDHVRSVLCLMSKYKTLKFPPLPTIAKTSSTLTTATTKRTTTTSSSTIRAAMPTSVLTSPTAVKTSSIISTTKSNSYIPQYTGDGEKHVERRRRSIASFLFIVVPLIVIKLLLLILLIITIRELRRIRKHRNEPKPLHSLEEKEKSRDSAEVTTGTPAMNLRNEPIKESVTPSKESISQLKSH
ncbi:unnamed protein product [Cylicocyclus nassatus]|uniref:Uncharacterized protein n=1 Tax=Cylicocyclus nassatus TaxID=53992 RepID=A0AA36GTK5_CYLNA|nr:unnamed protein product [Cylicocyclus nassatus]